MVVVIFPRHVCRQHHRWVGSRNPPTVTWMVRYGPLGSSRVPWVIPPGPERQVDQQKKWGFPWGFRRIHFAKLVEFTRITLGFMVITTYYNSNSWDLQSTSLQGGHLVAMGFKNMATWWCVFWFYSSSIDVLFRDVFSKDGDFVPVQLRQNTGISPSDADFIKLAWFLFCNKVGFEPGIIFIFFSTEELDLSNHWCI